MLQDLLLAWSGRDGPQVEAGLSAAEWYHTDPSPKHDEGPDEAVRRARRSGTPIGSLRRDVRFSLPWLFLFDASGPSWWSAPFWLAYGTLYGSAIGFALARIGHGTPPSRPGDTTDWLYQVASFFMVRNPFVTWRWKGHARHHTDTVIVGAATLVNRGHCGPPDFALGSSPTFFGLVDAWNGWGRMLYNASGRVHPEESELHSRSRTAEGRAAQARRLWGGDLTAADHSFVASHSRHGQVVPFSSSLGCPASTGHGTTS